MAMESMHGRLELRKHPRLRVLVIKGHIEIELLDERCGDVSPCNKTGLV